MPKSLDEFCQESGRAGRDGAPAVSTVYFGHGDRSRILALVGLGSAPSHAGVVRLNEMSVSGFACEFSFLSGVHPCYMCPPLQEFCMNATKCRHALLAGYFGEKDPPARCDTMCDVCENGVSLSLWSLSLV
jgi:superfamily II DNA helicase RecQ